MKEKIIVSFLRGVLLTAILGSLAYLALLVHASKTSEEHVLSPGEVYRFCGLYLDCHLSAVVDRVEVVELPNGGARYAVQVRFSSDAVRATMVLSHPQATLLDTKGRRIGPLEGPHGARLSPSQSVLAEFVFESPEVLEAPRLHVTKGGFLERLSERFLVGDPDSYGHAPVTLALNP